MVRMGGEDGLGLPGDGAGVECPREVFCDVNTKELGELLMFSGE